MSPIVLRPIREQFEHDRVIRQLQLRWRRRFEAEINVGRDEEASVKVGKQTFYPDLVLTSTSSGRRLHGVVEVETAESVNHLEAMAEWKHFAKARGRFYLYVPAGFTDVAERLCQSSKINVTEVWAYYAIGSEVKFSISYRSPRAKLAAKQAKTLKGKRKAAAKTKSRTAKKAKTGSVKKAKTVAARKKKPAVKPRAKTRTKTAKKKAVKKSVRGTKRAKTAAKRKK